MKIIKLPLKKTMASKGIFVFSSDVFVIIMLTEGQFDI
jgi:hypothetical protein